MRRREFIALLGAALGGWPAAPRAQSAIPLIGYLSSRSPGESAGHAAAFLEGLKAFGYIEGHTARIEYRWAKGEYARLPALANELASLHPAVIVAAGGIPSGRAAKAATGAIPVLFVGGDSLALPPPR